MSVTCRNCIGQKYCNLTGKDPGWLDIARECECFENAAPVLQAMVDSEVDDNTLKKYAGNDFKVKDYYDN